MPSAARPSPSGRKKSAALSVSDSRDGADALRDVQKRFAAVVMRPLTPDWTTQPVWVDGRSSREVVEEFIKPNDRMTALERIELYNKQYWYRLIDIMYEDYPGLAAILGDKRFHAFCEAYLQKHPSRSGLLRNLGKPLVGFIEKNPELTAPYTEMAYDMARFEWAQVEAFDRAEKPALRPEDLAGRDPTTTTLSVQPFVSLLDLNYAVDKLLIAVKRQSLRSEASNASDGTEHVRTRRRSPKPETIKLVVHRSDNLVYVKRIAPEAFAILSALRDGETIAEAVAGALESATSTSDNWPALIQEWFAVWMSFGWFCRR
jgi:hypothetical protein